MGGTDYRSFTTKRRKVPGQTGTSWLPYNAKPGSAGSNINFGIAEGNMDAVDQRI